MAVKDAAAQLDLRPGQSLELLQELHILTREGRINQDSRRKLKQVGHLVHIAIHAKRLRLLTQRPQAFFTF